MPTLMIQGTTSDAGKSTLVAGLCRVLVNRGVRVAPFKPQNMALNSAVTKDGGEIGRAQALQAVAAKTDALIDFNPILLKPNSDTGAQVIVHGKALSNMQAAQYQDYKAAAMQFVLESYQRLSTQFDCLMVEGAGSPAEINLREGDIANMGFAEQVDCPVIIVADIDKGGVFAHLVGTLALLSESEQNRVKGFVINRFRGDIALLQSGLDWLEKRTNKPVLGVLPFLHDLALDAEDALNFNDQTTNVEVRIAVLLFPHISNHTDFDSLRLNPHVSLDYVKVGQRIPTVDLIILPGSKNVVSDLTFLYQQQWHIDIQRHLRYGGKVLGVCGGFQMLGSDIYDPHHIESNQSHINGLKLAEFETTLNENKRLKRVSAIVCDFDSSNVSESLQCDAYEVHCGTSVGKALEKPFSKVDRENDGFISDDQQIIGTYLHGLFDDPKVCKRLLQWVNKAYRHTPISIESHRETQIEKLAKCFEAHLDIDQILKIVEGSI